LLFDDLAAQAGVFRILRRDHARRRLAIGHARPVPPPFANALTVRSPALRYRQFRRHQYARNYDQ
jgi:hypothetical protein